MNYKIENHRASPDYNIVELNCNDKNKIMKTLLISILALLTSCSSTAIVHEPYEITKSAIDKYFSEERDIYIGEGEKKKRASFSTKYTEVVKGKEFVWVHQLGSPLFKQSILKPTFLTVSIEKESESTTKLSVDVIEERPFMNKRTKARQGACLQKLRGYIKMNKENHNQTVD